MIFRKERVDVPARPPVKKAGYPFDKIRLLLTGCNLRISTRITIGAIILVVTGALALKFVEESRLKDAYLSEQRAGLEQKLHIEKSRLIQAIGVLRQDALFLSATPPVSGIVFAASAHGQGVRHGETGKVWEERLQQIFSSFLETHPGYYQLRFIGVADGGREIVRLDNRDGRIEITPPGMLQRKADSDYFKATLGLRDGEVYLSEFNLNREEGILQYPYRPTLRAAVPVFAPSGRIFGMVVINMGMGDFLESVASGLPAGVRAYLTNTNGQYLYHPDEQRFFGFERGGQHTIITDFPQIGAMFSRHEPDYLPLQAVAMKTDQYLAAERIYFDASDPVRFLLLAYHMPDITAAARIAAIPLEQVAGGFFAMLLVSGVALLFLRWTFAPLEQMAAAARKIAVGDMVVVLPQKGCGEIAALGDALDAMLDKLRVAAIAFETHEAIVITDRYPKILRVNRAFQDITGYTAEEVIGRNPNILSAERKPDAFYEEMWATIIREGKWSGEMLDKRKNGEIYPKRLTVTAVTAPDGTLTHYVGSFVDITERKKAEEEINRLVFFDPLTSLPNRRLMLDRLQQALANSARSGRHGAIMFIDLDNFKAINDTKGHDIGDLILIEVARRLQSCMREGDTVSRLSGDEFVVMLQDIGTEAEHVATQAEEVGKKILAAIDQPYLIRDEEYHSTASIGVNLFADHATTPDTLLKTADIAMYQAKSSGRNAIRFFDSEMQTILEARASMEADLRYALDKRQFRLYYQAQVDNTGHILGAEALIRWLHPTRGMVPPDQFIPIAEESPQILDIGQWVLETACQQLALWSKDGQKSNLALSVNVSPRQFKSGDFVDRVAVVLREYRVNPSLLKLELTESMVLHDVTDIATKMHAVKKMGVGLSMDDFGTGYSSLSHLKQLPLDQLKIDRSFVRDIVTDPNDAVMVKTIIDMAHNFRLNAIAEGVETEAQLEFLKCHGCSAYQGYLFSRPVPLEEFEALLGEGRRG